MFIRITGGQGYRAGFLCILLSLLCVGASAWVIGDDTYATRYDHALNGVAGTTLSYYHVPFTFSNATGANTGRIVYTNGTTQADWDDVRFTDTSGTVYPYWIESTNATCAEMWLNVTSIPEAGAVVRTYYDSDTATSGSNGFATFPLFDDFNDGTTLDTGRWTAATGSPVVGSGVVALSASEIRSTAQFDLGYAVRSSVKHNSSTSSTMVGLTPYSSAGADKYRDVVHSQYVVYGNDVSTGSASHGVNLYSAYHITEVGRYTGHTRFFIDGVLKRDETSIVSTSARSAMARSAVDQTFWVDWIAVRTYAAVEPTHGGYSLIAPPAAAFSADVTSGDAPLTVHFTDASAGSPTAWAWDFDNDGNTDSADQNPTYEYADPGTYTVKLTVTNGAGSDEEVKAEYIAVESPYDVPVAAFSANVTEGYTPLVVAFTDASAGPPTEWAWTYTGPNEFYDLDLNQNPVLTFTEPGTYSVSLRASNPAGNDYENRTDYITVLTLPAGPVASFTADVVSGHAPLLVQFTDTSTGSPTSWAWDFDGDTVADSTEQNPIYEYAANGTYTVTLQVSNAGGTGLETKADHIYVGALTARLLRASFSYSAPIGTAPFSVSFADTSVSNGTYARAWDFGDGATSAEPAPVHEYATAGKYDVELVITSDYTQDKSAARKAVMAYPAAAVSPLPTTTFGAHMTEIMESNWNVSVIGPIIPRAYTDALTPLAGDTGVGNMIFWGIIWVGVFMILFLRQGTPWLAALVGLVAGPGILTFLPPEWAHVGYICLAVTIGCSFFVIALGRFRST